jgi:hypothetical protein
MPAPRKPEDALAPAARPDFSDVRGSPDATPVAREAKTP